MKPATASEASQSDGFETRNGGSAGK